jgi:hypothetical protein
MVLYMKFKVIVGYIANSYANICRCWIRAQSIYGTGISYIPRLTQAIRYAKRQYNQREREREIVA